MNTETVPSRPRVEGISTQLGLSLWPCHALGVTLCMVALVCLVGCGGGGYSSPPPVVAISPVSATVAAGGQQQFTAKVTNSPNTAVTWEVNGISGGNAAVGTISNAGLYVAPRAETSVTISVVSQADANKSASAMLSVLGPHTIGVRPTATIAEFFERTTGNVFVPQGNNYVRLATQTNFDGTIFTYHSTFNVGLYNAVNVDTVLSQMQSNGYNVVRVWLNGCCHDNTLGNPAGGLSLPYVANLVDFLQRAKAHSIFVILTLDTVPLFGGYTDHFAGCTQFEIFNTHYLCKGGVDASTAFWRDFVNALVGQQAHLENILAYQIREEYSYDSNFLPLSLTSGTVTTANGQTYDMSSTASRQQMMDDGLIFWTNQTRAAIVAVDPTGIVTIGFFVPQSPNPTRVGDERFIQPYPAIAGSNADFVSLSMYPLVGDLTLPQIVQNFGFTGFQQQKPVMMGEFGALESDYPTEAIAATTVHDLQVQSCTFGFKAWLFWTWDTSNAEQVGPPFWPAILGDGLINQTLAPASRPDPCKN